MSAPPRFEQGRPWTFVHSNGTRTSYVMDRCMLQAAPSPDGKKPGLAAIYALTNPATGGEAQVSSAWLNRKPSQHSHWIFEGEALVQADEAADPGSGRAAA